MVVDLEEKGHAKWRVGFTKSGARGNGERERVGGRGRK